MVDTNLLFSRSFFGRGCPGRSTDPRRNASAASFHTFPKVLSRGNFQNRKKGRSNYCSNIYLNAKGLKTRIYLAHVGCGTYGGTGAHSPKHWLFSVAYSTQSCSAWFARSLVLKRKRSCERLSSFSDPLSFLSGLSVSFLTLRTQLVLLLSTNVTNIG